MRVLFYLVFFWGGGDKLEDVCKKKKFDLKIIIGLSKKKKMVHILFAL